jgi:hypothetical protein
LATDVTVPSTVSAVVVTTRCPTADTAALNSEVLLDGEVAVAVICSPAATARAEGHPNTASPAAFVVTFTRPR